ncbi:MAG TPA: HAMP domain-containing sensor histidine kinase [Thermomicrobiales bacterium]|nr:HAMP domain-containing sensor histidine kinase [Thermomicrobiales bacterium]
MTIRKRLTIFHTLVILGITFFLVLVMLVIIERAVGADVHQTTQSRAAEAARIVESSGTLTEDDIARLSVDGVYIVARAADGSVVAETRSLTLDATEADSTVWQDALATGKPAEGRPYLRAITKLGPTYVYAIPITGGSSIAVIEAAKAYSATGHSLFFFAPFIVVGVLIALVVAIGGSYWLAGRALAPVNAVVNTARQITESDLSRRLPVSNPNDEIGRLVGTFNEILARLEIAFNQREETLATQRRFVADASHELRTPLSSILGYARMLQQWGLEHPDIARESFSAIEQEALRMNELVEGLLRLARGDEGAPLDLQPHDLAQVASDAVAAARPAANGKVTLLYEPPSQPVMATFDTDRLHQAAGILLDNAIKYTPAGGVVTVAVQSNGRAAELSVSDTGIGIPPHHLPHIFERFYRVDEARSAGGMGLGLSIVQQIAEAHGGYIDVTSTPNVGSTFTLHLPVSHKS